MKDDIKESKALNMEDLENISGGYIFNSKNISNADPNKPWEILDGNGDLVDRFSDYKEALKAAGEKGHDPLVIDWDTVCELRNNKK